MESAELGRDTASMSAGCQDESGELSIACGNGKGKLRLLTRGSLDGRTQAARLFDHLVASIEADLGGRNELTAIEQTLVRAYASAAITIENLNARLLSGEEIDFAHHSQCVSAMVRVASRLGLQRRAKPVLGIHDTGGLLDAIAHKPAPGDDR
jgi:hypothetical protein